MSQFTKIKIPFRFAVALKSIGSLSEDDTISLYDTLRKIPSGVTRKKFISILSENLKFDKIEYFEEAIFHLGGLLNQPDLSTDQLATDLVESIIETTDKDTDDKIDAELSGILNDRLKNILISCDSLKPIFEAISLNGTFQSILKDSEIQSNVHALYDDDFKIKHGVVYHLMKLNYLNDEKLSSNSFAMDKADLNKLKSQIEDALLKEQKILSANNNVNFLDISE